MIQSDRELAATPEDHRAGAERLITDGEQKPAVAEEELRRIDAAAPIDNLGPRRHR